jgi:hypothetical protein
MSRKKIAVTECRITAFVSILFLAIGCLPTQAQQVYRCVKDGKTSFQGTPCEAGSTSALQSGPQLPWEGLRPNMSAGDVRCMVADVLTGTQSAGVRLHKQGIVIAGIPFNAEYFFDCDGRLESVQVTKVGEINGEGLKNVSANSENLADYEKLARLMRTKYGTRISSTVENGVPGASRLAVDTQWAAQGGKVSISITPRTATTSVLSLEYRPRPSLGYPLELSRPRSSRPAASPVRRAVPAPAFCVRRS